MQKPYSQNYNLRDTSAVLIVWSEAATDAWSQLRTTFSRLMQNASTDDTQPSSPASVIDGILHQSMNGGATRMRYCDSDPDSIAEAVAQAASQSCKQVLVMPVALAMDKRPDPKLFEGMAGHIAELDTRHPDTEIIYLGPPFDRVRRITSILSTAHEPETDQLLQQTIERGFKGDWALFARFMQKLQTALPVDTRVALRGSAVTGESYPGRQPFDVKGPGTSDLDVVLMSESAMAEWKPEAFFFPNVNTMPLSDEMPDIAPRLNPVRVELQQMVGRPVNIQAMQKWFLDMRSELQGTPYVFLDA
jgi:hypothetical protein